MVWLQRSEAMLKRSKELLGVWCTFSGDVTPMKPRPKSCDESSPLTYFEQEAKWNALMYRASIAGYHGLPWLTCTNYSVLISSRHQQGKHPLVCSDCLRAAAHLWLMNPFGDHLEFGTVNRPLFTIHHSCRLIEQPSRASCFFDRFRMGNPPTFNIHSRGGRRYPQIPSNTAMEDPTCVDNVRIYDIWYRNTYSFNRLFIYYLFIYSLIYLHMSTGNSPFYITYIYIYIYIYNLEKEHILWISYLHVFTVNDHFN